MAVNTSGQGFMLMGDLAGLGQGPDGSPLWSAGGKTYAIGNDGQSIPYAQYQANQAAAASKPAANPLNFAPGQSVRFTSDPTVGGAWTHTSADTPLFRAPPGSTPAAPPPTGTMPAQLAYSPSAASSPSLTSPNPTNFWTDLMNSFGANPPQGMRPPPAAMPGQLSSSMPNRPAAPPTPGAMGPAPPMGGGMGRGNGMNANPAFQQWQQSMAAWRGQRPQMAGQVGQPPAPGGMPQPQPQPRPQRDWRSMMSKALGGQ